MRSVAGPGPVPHSPRVRRLGIGTAFGLLILGQLLLQASVLVFVAITMVARGLEYGPALRMVTSDPLPLGAAQLAALGAVTALGVWLWTPGEETNAALGFVPTRVRYALVASILGLSLQLPMVELTTLIARALPMFAHSPETDAAITALTRVSSPLRAFTVPFTFVVIAPVTEELLFRGLILRSLNARYGSTPAILLSALMFGAFHFDPQALVFASLVGLLLGWIALRTRSTMPSIALHAGFNAVPVLFPEEVAQIPGFNTGTTDLVPWPLVLGSSVVALTALAVLVRITARKTGGDQVS